MKNKILNKAADLFLSYGFKSVTMDDIADKLGISKKTIYTYFPTKTKLVEATTSLTFKRVSDLIFNICSTNKNPIEELYLIKSLVLEQLKNEKSSPQYQLQKYYPAIFSSIKKKQIGSVKDCLEKNLKEGVSQGLYRESIDNEIIMALYFNGVLGIRDEELFPKEKFLLSTLIDSQLEYHLRAIVTDKGLKILENIIKK